MQSTLSPFPCINSNVLYLCVRSPFSPESQLLLPTALKSYWFLSAQSSIHSYLIKRAHQPLLRSKFCTAVQSFTELFHLLDDSKVAFRLWTEICLLDKLRSTILYILSLISQSVSCLNKLDSITINKKKEFATSLLCSPLDLDNASSLEGILNFHQK